MATIQTTARAPTCSEEFLDSSYLFYFYFSIQLFPFSVPIVVFFSILHVSSVESDAQLRKFFLYTKYSSTPSQRYVICVATSKLKNVSLVGSPGRLCTEFVLGKLGRLSISESSGSCSA